MLVVDCRGAVDCKSPGSAVKAGGYLGTFYNDEEKTFGLFLRAWKTVIKRVFLGLNKSFYYTKMARKSVVKCKA